MYDEKEHRFTRRYGNIGCILGLVISGIVTMAAPLTDPQMRLLLVAGVLLGAGIGMFLGRKKDHLEASKTEEN